MTLKQSRMALAALKWTLDELAKKSGVPRITVARFQSGKGASASSIAAMQSAMEASGVIFERKASRLIVSVPE